MKLKVYTNEILLEALSYMRLVQHRRSITSKELSLYQEHIVEESAKQGVEIEIVHDCTERLIRLRELVDTIFIGGETVYRINPSTTTKELDDLAYFYRKQHNTVVPGMNSSLFIAKLNDFDPVSERDCPEFRQVDERHQLDIMYQLYNIEKQKRMLEQTLQVMQANSSVSVDDIQAESILEENTDMSKSEFFSKMSR